MPSLSFAASDQPVTALSPLDSLAAELGSEAARIERDLRRDFAVGMAEIRRELEAVQRRGAEMELRAANAERALADAVRERLAAVRDGDSVTIEDVRPLVETEVAKQISAVPKPPDAEAVAATISAQIDARLTDIAERAAVLVERPELPMLPDIGLMVTEESDRREGDLVAKVLALVPVPDVGGAVATEFERQLPDVVTRAVNLVPPVELPDVSAAVADEFAKREEALVERAALIVKIPEIPDIPALVGDAVASAFATIRVPEDGKSADPEVTADLVSISVAEALACLSVDFVNHADVQEIARSVVDQCVSDIAKRAADLIPAVELPDLPDFSALVLDALIGRQGEIVERVVSLIKVPEAPALPDIDGMVDNKIAAAFATVQLPENGKDADPGETALLVRRELAEVTVGLAAAFTSPTDVEEIAQATIDRALATVPTGITIDEMREAIETELPNVSELVRFAADEHLTAPDHLLGLLERAGNLLAQPFALAFDGSATSTIAPRHKTIKIKRDKNGDLVANVIERPLELLSQTPDSQSGLNGLSSAPSWNKTMRMKRDENGDLTAELTEGQDSHNDQPDL